MLYLLVQLHMPSKGLCQTSNAHIQYMANVDSLVSQVMKRYDIPGLSVGIVKNGERLVAKGYGIGSVKKPFPVTESTSFHTASVSKLFTALAVMRLVQDGKLTLEDSVFRLLPDLRYKNPLARQITVRSLLNHTSGIPDLLSYNWSAHNQAEDALETYMLRKRFRLKNPPHTAFHYSNLGYDLLGFLVEKVSGVKFEVYVKENVLVPGQMPNADFRYFEIPDSVKARPHSKKRIGKTIYERKVYPYTREHSPSSTLIASASELANWMTAFLQSLNEGTYSSAYRSMISASTQHSSRIGLGFQLYNVHNKSAIGHYGGDKGFRSYLVMLPTEGIGVVVLSNCDYNEDFRQELAHEILKMTL